MKNKEKLGIVIPYYNARDFIVSVVNKAINYSDHIVIVNDKSPDLLPLDLLSEFSQVQIINAPNNLGVGGATKLGLNFLKDNKKVEVIIKLDADDQMDANFIPLLVDPVLNGNFGFAKGNRFRDFKALKEMPWIRRFGNTFLSFLSKIATGYWNCFDFNNGFFAISKENVSLINFNSISNNYFFETSLISELYFQDVKIKEIAMPAIYGDEKSNMNVFKMPFTFSYNLFKKFISRILKSYFVYDFNIGTVYILFGIPLLLGGVIFGGYHWYDYSSKGILTPVGTIMISTLLIILGFQLILQAIQYDIMKTPKNN